jgi:hypothetical protein
VDEIIDVKDPMKNLAASNAVEDVPKRAWT